MPASTPHIVLVTPVWNDSSRLEGFGLELAKTLADSGLKVSWVIADDGSEAAEKEKLAQLCVQFGQIYSDVMLHSYEERSRKGGAIDQSWQAFPEADYYAFVDADGAIAAATMRDLLKHAVDSDRSGESFVAVRELSGQMDVRRTFFRRLTSYLFREMVRTFVGLKLEDTQCGAKVISGKAYRVIESELEERGYVFDVELLAALSRGAWPVREVPIAWREVSGSKLCLWRDIWSMLAGLLRIRKRLKKAGS